VADIPSCPGVHPGQPIQRAAQRNLRRMTQHLMASLKLVKETVPVKKPPYHRRLAAGQISPAGEQGGLHPGSVTARTLTITASAAGTTNGCRQELLPR